MIKYITHLCMAVFVLLSSIGVKAHTMYCHDSSSVSLFVPPKACCDVPFKKQEDNSAVAIPSCCIVFSGELAFEYENTVPDIQFTDFSFDLAFFESAFIGPQPFYRKALVIEDQNLPPPRSLKPHRSLFQVYII